jgi:hypothetical protein
MICYSQYNFLIDEITLTNVVLPLGQMVEIEATKKLRIRPQKFDRAALTVLGSKRGVILSESYCAVNVLDCHKCFRQHIARIKLLDRVIRQVYCTSS